jgi:hypothetical protein
MWIDFSREASIFFFFYGECSRLEWKRKVLLRYVVCLHFCTEGRTFIFQYYRVVHFNVDSVVRLPLSKILQRTAYCLKNIVLKRRCVIEEKARVPTAEVSLCSFCYCNIHLLEFILKFCFFCFRSPLISCASPWRAGETKNDASPKLWTFLVIR